MMSAMMQKVYEVAKKFDAALLATEFHSTIAVRHSDGRRYHFEEAIAYVFTHDDFLYEKELKSKKYWATKENDEYHEDDDNHVSQLEIGWLLVFTEHNGFHVFACGDLAGYQEYKKIDTKEFDKYYRSKD